MALTVHPAERTDLLADSLGDLLAIPLEDPFAEEIVVVPAKGVERWLTQRLSHRLGTSSSGADGVCAGVRFLNPRSLVSMLLDRDRDDPWDPDRLVWPLLSVIDDSLDEPWCTTLAVHLGHGLGGGDGSLRRNRRYSVARRLAGLYAGYAQQRPGLIADWRVGRDTDGAGGSLDPDLLWQAELWRRLLGRVAEPAPDLRHADTLARLSAGGAGLELPSRLSLFGHTRLPVTEVELLHALGEHRDVHVWLPQPSPQLWDELSGIGGVVRREDDDSARRVRHPLLASLGRDSRELRRTLDGIPAGPAEAVEPVQPPVTLLGWLQTDLRANAAPEAEARATRTHDAADRSVQVHACHGPARQVDVLREVLVGLLEDDPTLEPRDILVMCPDIETYAPLISAGFGLADVVEEGGHPAHRLRVRLADRALTSTNPLLAVAATLVELAGGRVTASEVLDLAGADAVRARFRFTDDDLARVTGWVKEAGIRWGLDAEQRQDFGMDRFQHNTWRTGLDRILLGVAMSDDDYPHVGRGLPLDDVGSNDIDLVGRLAELLNRLERCLGGLESASAVGDWMSALRDGVHALTAAPGDDAWQVPQFERELARAVDSADGGGVPLRLADVRAMLESRLGGRPTRANFRTGTLTVCTMVPMRSVPHRVVCLVGLDDGLFPRVGTIDGDDVLARRPLTGEREVRSEDRQLLLDAVLAAREKLVITYTGANEHSGATRPPAVPLGEILDALDRTAASPVRDSVLLRHPLQPYDARNLVPGALTGELSFSFDRASLAGAVAAAGPRTPRPPFLESPLDEQPREDVSLADLKAFFTHPVRAFLKNRLDVSVPLEEEDVANAIPIEVRGLDKWQIGDRLLRGVLEGHSGEAVFMAELLRGSLPPHRLGERALETVVRECQSIYRATDQLRSGASSTSRDIELDLGGGRRLTGTVNGIFGQRVLTVGYSALKAKQRLGVWIDLLALSAAFPDEHWTGHAVGKGDKGADGYVSGPLDHRALDWLRTLVELQDEGRCRPLPLPVETACSYAGQQLGVARSRRPDNAWASTDSSPVPGERDDAWHVLVYGEKAPLSALVAMGLGDLAVQVWEPILTGGERRVVL